MMKTSAALLLWAISPRQMSIAALVLALGVSAFFVSFSSHQTRELYRNLHMVQKKRDDLDFEYQKLILERGAFADYSRITDLAKKQLNMRIPRTDELVVLK
ncbi:MAG: cell division protein FtsL [Pseudomonadota bacterium]|nr:cell division protein FtsL [Pseudomonadota bacterium]